jgi:hypothetical protein
MLANLPGTDRKDCAEAAHIGITVHSNSNIDSKEKRLITVPPVKFDPAVARFGSIFSLFAPPGNMVSWR